MITYKLSRFLVVASTICMIAIAAGGKASAVERYEVLQYGDKDKYVFRLQEELHARGYLEAEPTGYFGIETQKALSRYQERKGLEADGKAGPVTQKKIYGEHFEPLPATREIKEEKERRRDSDDDDDKKSTQKRKYKDPTSIGLGDEGKSIKNIQKRLKELGYYTYRKNTSYYGAITEEAVKEFQEQNDLESDGVVGKRTKKLLFSDRAKKYSKKKAKKSSKSSRKQSTGAAKQSSKGKTKSERVLNLANSLKGKRYRTGGNGPNTFDCSGYVAYVLKANGISTPRTSSEMSKYSAWDKIESRSDLKKGDLVFFASPGKTSGVGHVGIYIGGSRFIHCSSGKAYGVTVSSFSSGSYNSRYQFGRRIFS